MAQRRIIKDIIARQVMFTLALVVCLFVFVIAFGLFAKSIPILKIKGLSEMLFSAQWRPSDGQFGFAPFILGTIAVTVAAMIFAIPSSLLAAIYLAEYANKRTRQIVKPVLDLLGGISPVIFGVFGVLVIVPFVKSVGELLVPAQSVTGFSILSAGIVLAIMVFPAMTSVAEEVIHSVPHEARESSLALGATRWETVKYVILRKSGAGVIAAIILGLSRAFGETIAVLMVVGNVVQIPKSVFGAAYTLPALIANNYGEMMSIPLYDSALLFAGLILLAVTVIFNVIAWCILLKIEKAYV